MSNAPTQWNKSKYWANNRWANTQKLCNNDLMTAKKKLWKDFQLSNNTTTTKSLGKVKNCCSIATTTTKHKPQKNKNKNHPNPCSSIRFGCLILFGSDRSKSDFGYFGRFFRHINSISDQTNNIYILRKLRNIVFGTRKKKQEKHFLQTVSANWKQFRQKKEIDFLYDNPKLWSKSNFTDSQNIVFIFLSIKPVRAFQWEKPLLRALWIIRYSMPSGQCMLSVWYDYRWSEWVEFHFASIWLG